MRQDLLAPPKLSLRGYAAMAAFIHALIVAVVIARTVVGSFTVLELVVNILIIGALGAGAVWAYARLLRLARRSRPEHMPYIHGAVSASGLGALLLAMLVGLRGTGISLPLWQVTLVIGMTLASGGWSRRIGDSLHCPKCEYQFAFADEPPERTPIHCPECGTPWLGLLKKGRRVRSARLVAAGIALAVGGFVVLTPMLYMGWLAPRLPTPLLVAFVYPGPSRAGAAWSELARRPLDAHWTEVMGRRALALRAADPYDRCPIEWLEKTIGAGALSAGLTERFYREAFQAELHVPRRVRRGETFTAHLRVTRAAHAEVTLGVMFAGYALGDEVARLERQNETLWAHEVDPGIFAHHNDVLPETLRAPDQPGEIRVRAVYWVVLQPTFRDEIAWQADGTPARPSTALWFERVEVEKTLRVE